MTSKSRKYAKENLPPFDLDELRKLVSTIIKEEKNKESLINVW